MDRDIGGLVAVEHTVVVAAEDLEVGDLDACTAAEHHIETAVVGIVSVVVNGRRTAVTCN